MYIIHTFNFFKISFLSIRRAITSSVPTIERHRCSVCLEKCMPWKVPTNSWTSFGRWSVQFSPRSRHHGSNLKVMGVCQGPFCLFWKRHMTEYLKKNFGGYFKNIALMVSCCRLLSSFTVNQKFVFVWTWSNKTFSCGRWSTARVRFVNSPFYYV